MATRVLAVIFCLSFSTAVFAQETCGIGTAIKKFNKIDTPSSDDFSVPLKVITNNESLKVPFYYCDADIDLRPGIRFLDVYIDSVLSTGRPINDPSIVFVKKIQKEMKSAINKDADPN